MVRPLPYYPGKPPSNPGPLARYLPPLPEGVATAWLKERLPPGGLVLDPFGASPRTSLEAARAGFRVLVAANNPVARMLLEMGALGSQPKEYQAALADLASAYKGGERIEPHIRSLYITECASCNQPVEVEYFLWERSADYPFARLYSCTRCGDHGEHPTTQKDKDRAVAFTKGGLDRARALERIVPSNDPDREHAEEALSVYLSRSLYALFTLINKLDMLDISPGRRLRLSALLLSVCDRANTLWAHPTTRERPRQLSVPSVFREYNIWLALENSISQWAGDLPQLDLTLWPELPLGKPGLTLFEGRLKDLAVEISAHKIGAVLAALPRPNQAYWTLSALWAAWIWGREAVGPFKSVLRRRRYDWGWHTAALSSAFHSLANSIDAGVPMLGLVGEAEPGFLSAALLAGEGSGFDLEGFAMRTESGQAQVHWRKAATQRTPDSKPARFAVTARQAAITALKERGQPCDYLPVHAAALLALADQKAFPREQEINSPLFTTGRSNESPAEQYSRLQNGLKEVFSFRGGFLRFDGSVASLEVGSWWIMDEEGLAPPISDRVEIAIWRYLQERKGCRFEELDAYLCEVFPGLLTPEIDLILHCLQSYAEQLPDQKDNWRLRGQESLELRRQEIEETQKMLFTLATRLSYSVSKLEGIYGQSFATNNETTIAWLNPSGLPCYIFYLTASAAIGGILFHKKAPYKQQENLHRIIVLPGSRANLVSYKLRNDARLKKEVEASWTFLKYRHLRRLIESTNLNQQNLPTQLEMDPLTYTASQLRLL